MLEKVIKIKGRNKFEKKIIRLAVFVWNLIIYSIPLNLLEYRIIPVSKNILNALAYLEHIILNLAGIPNTVEGNVISVCNTTFEIIDRCSGYKSLLGLFAIIMATPTESIKERFIWFLYLAPVTIILNIVRIFSTIYLHCVYGLSIEFVHEVLWQILTTSAVISLWIMFLIKNKDKLIDF